MKIIIQQSNCKFINNLDSLQYQSISVNIKNNIYQIEQIEQPDVYVLIAEKLSNEELHFCSNNPNKKILIYNQSPKDLDVPNATIISDTELPCLYNPNRFSDNKSNKDIEYSYFLDNDSALPENLTYELLPNKINHIKLFNNRLIDHPQNLGLLSEDDKAVILNRTKKYICNNNFYAIEAIKCGCEVVDTSLSPIDVNIDDCQTYSNYFESLI
tara:strand:+ start:1401 stop:2039 length:639 start_codon:yes stop_codon:yes gene_type:complete